MRTARRVIVAILLFACTGVLAQDEGPGTSALDRELTLVGRDETAIPVPPPAPPSLEALPTPDLTPLPSRTVPPIIPSASAPGLPLTVPDPRDVLSDTLSR